MGATLKQFIQVSRNIAHELMPPTLDNVGLIPSLEDLIESIKAIRQVQIDFHNYSTVKQLKNKWSEIKRYRVLQEMLQIR